MDKEYKATRALLGKSQVKVAPVGLGDAVMQKVRAMEEKRVERSVIWALVLRGICVAVFVSLIVGVLVSGAARLGDADWWKVAERIAALCMFAVGIRVFRILVV